MDNIGPTNWNFGIKPLYLIYLYTIYICNAMLFKNYIYHNICNPSSTTGSTAKIQGRKMIWSIKVKIFGRIQAADSTNAQDMFLYTLVLWGLGRSCNEAKNHSLILSSGNFYQQLWTLLATKPISVASVAGRKPIPKVSKVWCWMIHIWGTYLSMAKNVHETCQNSSVEQK